MANNEPSESENEMTVPFVHSGYERRPDDAYHTIDERCVFGFLQHFQPIGLCIDVCAPDGSGIVDTLIGCGYNTVCGADAFEGNIKAQWIITNPPYTRPLVDQIITRQIERVECGDVYGLAVLLRSNFDFAKSRTWMFDHRLYVGQIKLRFRPWWSENRKAQPIHNYVWQLWRQDAEGGKVMYASGEMA